MVAVSRKELKMVEELQLIQSITSEAQEAEIARNKKKARNLLLSIQQRIEEAEVVTTGTGYTRSSV